VGCVQHRQPERHKDKLWSWRWDRSDLGLYYAESRVRLANIDVPLCLFSCGPQCHCQSHYTVIDEYYENIVHALFDAASSTVLTYTL